jgi:two-component system NarL family response regulator
LSDEIKILIVDDHPIVREGWMSVLNRREDMRVIGEAENGKEALDIFAKMQPDVVLVDLRMPEMDGVTLIEHLREKYPAVRIIVLTTYDGDENIFRALQLGAMAYLLKDTPRQELLETIRDVHKGRKRIPPNIASRLADRMVISDLTARELDVLRWVAQGYSNKQIGAELGIAEGTVKAHMNGVLGKLDANDRTHAVTIAYQRGILTL